MKQLIIIFLLLPAVSVTAQSDGMDSPFSFGTGARELALGESDLANCSPYTAAFWNPAALNSTQKLNLGIFHTKLYESGINYSYLGLAYPTVDFGTIGVGVFRLGVNDIEKRDENNLLTGSFNDSRIAFYLAYGRSIRGYDIGISAMIEHHAIDEYNSTSSPGINISLSRIFHPGFTPVPEIDLCLAVRNLIKPNMRLMNETMSYPNSVNFGLTFRFIPSHNLNQHFNLSSNIQKTSGSETEYSFGVEYCLFDALNLRGSIHDENFSFGAGVEFKFVSFDYALVERDLDNLHMFSFTTSFGMTLDQKRKLREQRREREFERMMNENLDNRNSKMIEKLFQDADDALRENDYEKAVSLYDRGLFMARVNGYDSTDLYRKALKSYNFLNELQKKRKYESYVDTALMYYDEGDYLASRQYANLALTINSQSREAKKLIMRADSVITVSATRDRMIQNKLLQADSLLTYNRVDEALAVLQSLNEIADNNPEVATAIRKAEFKKQKQIAADRIRVNDFKRASIAIDSALSIYPDHPCCKRMSRKIVQETKPDSPLKKPGSGNEQKNLSDDLKREIGQAYSSGQKFFEQGDLAQAIEYWETVERISPGYMSVREYLVKAYKFVGVKYYGQNSLQEAIASWKKALAIDPDNREIKSYISRTENEILKLQELTYDSE